MSVNVYQNGALRPIAGYSGLDKVLTFAVAANAWVANTDPSTSTDYPYIATISTTEYTTTSTPVWQLVGAGNIPTAAETEEIAKVLYAYFSATNIILYATDQPTLALNLIVKGS